MKDQLKNSGQTEEELISSGGLSYEFPHTNFINSSDFTDMLSIVPDDPDALQMILGTKDNYIVHDLLLWHNVMIGGTTGSGKTQLLYDQICYWLCRKTPEQLKVFIFGSKEINYEVFKKLDLCVVDNENIQYNESRSCCATILSLISECNERSRLFLKAGVRNKKDYNKEFRSGRLKSEDGHRLLRDIVLIIDDLTAFFSEELERNLMTLSTLNLNAGIYIILATSQIILPAIKVSFLSNFIFRIAFRTMSEKESKKILDYGGAERIMDVGGFLIRDWGKTKALRTVNIAYDDMHRLVDFVIVQEKKFIKFELPQFDAKPDIETLSLKDLDSMFEDAARLIVLHQQGSTSLIQRKLKLGYNRAGHIIDQLEQVGVIGPFEGSKAREVLIPDDYALEMFLNELTGNKDSSVLDVTKEDVRSDNLPMTGESKSISYYREAIKDADNEKKKGFWTRIFGR
jgi:S-DNA-T family DNA segregation ATPase FtsK/SpoIIIE